MLPNLRNINLWIILIGDVFLVGAAYFGAYLVRFEGTIAPSQMYAFQSTVFWIVPVYLFTFSAFKLYNGMWRYTGVVDSFNLFKAVVLASVFTMTLVLLLNRFNGYSRSVFIINGLLIFLVVGGFRICIRFLFSQQILPGFLPLPGKKKGRRLLIVGAGSAGEKLIRELRENNGLNYHPIGLIDDNPAKERQTLHGVPVLGPLDKLTEMVEKYGVEEIAIAIPSASTRQMRRIIDACKKLDVAYKTLPGMVDIIQGKVTFSALREVCYEDLLKRAPIQLDNDVICRYLTGKCVLVTGGAGSIGSELCRQIAAFSPRKLIVLERNESGLYDLVLDIQSAFPELKVIPALAAVQNRERMQHIFSFYRPEVVFHAAAYKHVPMMENHPWEAIFNNVVGSRVLLQQCRNFGVQRCVMVSTDKAVRPTNVMGATKRLVELLTQSYAALNNTRYMAVRFGNVLGSVGSVLPLFKKQIAAGGPVTVTAPDMTRFFMTIPEACSLILQSGAYGKGGEIFVLKMGTPVRIDDMARDLISLSGYRPGEDIKIHYTGLRPGEKLYEELITQGEGIRKTEHEDIMVLAANDNIVPQELDRHIEDLVRLAGQGDAERIKQKLHDIIPEYCPWTAGVSSTAGKHSTVPLTPTTQPLKDSTPLFSAGSSLNQVAAEDRLLLQLLSIDAKHGSKVPFEALPVPDWEKVIQSALKHNVASLLYLRIKRSGLYERVPLKIGERLRKIYLYFVQKGMRQQYWLGKLLELLNQHGLPALILSGPHLGENIYRNIAARPLSDVNLFLSEKDRRRIRAIQSRIEQYIQRSGLYINIIDKLSYPGFKKEIQLHEIRQRAQTAEIANYKVSVPCPEDLLLHLCLNFVCFYQYRFAGIQTLCDIREILYQYEATLDWDNVLRESRATAMTNAVGLTLILAEELLNAPVSKKTIQMFGSRDQFSFVKRFALQNIFDESQLCKTLPPHFIELWESRSLLKKTHALYQLMLLSPSLAGFEPEHGGKTFQNIHACKTKILFTMENCARTSAMLLAGDEKIKDQLRQRQQNTLIWEWIHGKREYSERLFTIN